MPYVEITSAQLKALTQLDRGRGMRVHGEPHALGVEVFVGDGRFIPTVVLRGGEAEAMAGRGPSKPESCLFECDLVGDRVIHGADCPNRPKT